MELGNQSPEYCWIECQKQGLVTEGTKIPFIGIANATFCFCGLDYSSKVNFKSSGTVMDIRFHSPAK